MVDQETCVPMNQALSLRSITPAIGQGSNALLKGCLISMTSVGRIVSKRETLGEIGPLSGIQFEETWPGNEDLLIAPSRMRTVQIQGLAVARLVYLSFAIPVRGKMLPDDTLPILRPALHTTRLPVIFWARIQTRWSGVARVRSLHMTQALFAVPILLPTNRLRKLRTVMHWFAGVGGRLVVPRARRHSRSFFSVQHLTPHHVFRF